MEVDWKMFINFSEDIIILMDFFQENAELENTAPFNSFLEEFQKEPIELLIPIESLTNNLNTTSYQYILRVSDSFDDWLFIDNGQLLSNT